MFGVGELKSIDLYALEMTYVKVMKETNHLLPPDLELEQ